MKCSYLACSDTIKNPQVCKACGKVTYCSTNCRVQDFYKNHKNFCKQLAIKVSPDSSTSKSSIQTPLDKYEITNEILGTGSYGEVKLIKNKSTFELFALKLIDKKSLEEEKIPHDLILREISVHKTLSHPNIIKLIESFEDPHKLYIILEYAEGGNLFELIKQNGKLPESQARSIQHQSVLAVQYLTENSIVHRDIKPENILIGQEGSIKLCDFGWCVKGQELRSTFCGTIDYMAPEMVKNQKHSHEVDVWALGVLLYEMLHGYPPFRASRESEKYFNIVNCKFSFAEWVSEEAQDLILKMIQKDPKKRIKVKEILNHSFFKCDEKSESYEEKKDKKGKIANKAKGGNLKDSQESSLKIGDSFRYYVQGYGMDDAVVLAIGEQCEVEFKKSRAKMKVEREEVLRRVNRGLKNSREIDKGLSAELGNEMKDDGLVKKNLSQQQVEHKFFNVMENIEKNSLGDSRSIQNSPTTSFSKFLSANESLASSVSERKNSEKERNEFKLNLNKGKELGKGLGNNRPFNDSMLSLSERLELLAESHSNLHDSNEINNSSSEKSKTNLADVSKIKDSIGKGQNPPIEESIYNNLNEWIRAPVKRKKRKQRPPLGLNSLLRDRSLDKQLEKFKERFVESESVSLAETPVISPRVNAITSRKLESLDENPEFDENNEKSYKEPNVDDEKLNDLKIKQRRSNEYWSPNQRLSEKIEEDKNPDEPKEESRFVKMLKLRVEKKEEKFFPFPVKNPRYSTDSANSIGSPLSPNFADDKKPNIRVQKCSSSSRSFSDSDEKDKKGVNVFDYSEKSSIPSAFSKQDPSEDFKESVFPISPKTLIRSNARKKCKKIDSFEDQRDKIEMVHNNFYSEIDENWEQKKTIVKAQELSDTELEEEKPKRTFSEFDQVLLNSPSIVPEKEGARNTIEKSNQKLKGQKRNLEQMILNMDKIEPPYLRRIARPKKKGGFFNWLGTFMGCSERY